MRGSIVKRTDSRGRRVYYVLVDEVAADGKRRRRWRTDPATGSAFTTKKAAESFAARLVTTIGDGAYIEPSDGTLGDYLAAWLETIRPTVRGSTWHSYEKNVRLHITPYIGRRPLDKISAIDIDKLYATLLIGGRKDHKAGGLSPRTVAYVGVILGRALKDATRKGLISRNPAPLADRPRSARREMTTWTPHQAGEFLDSLTEHRLRTLFVFLALTGTRRGEALGLRWRDLDMDAARASIVQTVTKVGGQVVLGPTKTTSGRRVVALDAALIELLREHRRRQAARRLLLGSGWLDHDLVFCNVEGGPQYPETVSRLFTAQVAASGLPVIRLHDLRHTWASVALAAGVHPKVVQERLGHASISITLDIYSHVVPTLHDDAANAVAGLLRGSSR